MGASWGPFRGLLRVTLSASAVLEWGNGREPTYADGVHLSKYPTNDYRTRLRRITAAPCPFGSAYVAECCGQRPAKLSDHLFPESVWKVFGGHVEENEHEEEEEEASWAVLIRRNGEKKQMPTSLKHSGKMQDVGLFGPSWRTSWRPLG
eukprot:4765392-Pyramimonas_sp.AAC.1